MGDDIQDDIDSAAEHQQQMDEARRHKEQDPDVKFWANLHDEAIARQRVEDAQIAALNFALLRIYRES